MKRHTLKKAHKGTRRAEDRPLEFDRGWHELEAQHERLKSDMMSLAAMLGVNSRERF